MESVSKNTIFAGDYFSLLHKNVQNHKLSNENNHLPAWRDFQINFSRPLFTLIFRPKIVFFDADSILRVKTMYESVKEDVLRHLIILLFTQICLELWMLTFYENSLPFQN